MWKSLGNGISSSQKLPDVRVKLYTRRGCHLCQDAHQFLLAQQKRWRYQLELVDIDADVELRRAYDQCVPVVEVAGKVRFRGRINPVLWRRLLTALANRKRKDEKKKTAPS
jgi:hypothetical protein